MKSVSNVRRCRAQLDRPGQRRLCGREVGPTAHKQFKFILETPRSKEGTPADRQVTPSRRVDPVNQQFNTVRPVMSNRLNSTSLWVNSRDSQAQESFRGVVKDGSDVGKSLRLTSSPLRERKKLQCAAQGPSVHSYTAHCRAGAVASVGAEDACANFRNHRGTSN